MRRPLISSPLELFLQRVRARIVWRQRLGRIEIALVISCAVALILSITSLVFASPSLLTSVVILGVGCLIGIGWAAGVRVTLSNAALRADRELKLKDLLASAWAIQPDFANESWKQTVLSQANNRCGTLDTAAIEPKILNGRAWRLIALFAILVTALGFWTPSPASSSSDARGPALVANIPWRDSTRLFQSQPNQSIRPVGAEASDEASRSLIDAPEADSSSPSAGHSTASTDRGSESISSGASPGRANGLAQSPVKLNQRDDLPDSDTKGLSNQKGTITARGAASVLSQSTANKSPVAGPGSAQTSASAAPWQTASWPAPQAAANQSLTNGPIDPAYEPLVRDYFAQP